jgi:hypothetical protein
MGGTISAVLHAQEHLTLLLHRKTRIGISFLNISLLSTHTNAHNIYAQLDDADAAAISMLHSTPLPLLPPRQHLRHQNPQSRLGRGPRVVPCSLWGWPGLFHSTTPTNACSASAFCPRAPLICQWSNAYAPLLLPHAQIDISAHPTSSINTSILSSQPSTRHETIYRSLGSRPETERLHLDAILHKALVPPSLSYTWHVTHDT